MKRIFIFFIKLYKKFISPGLNSHCIYTPTCSEYAIDAINEYGAIKGSIMGFKRILRCNPLSKGGYDPVPKKISQIKEDYKWE
ncbi:MAG: membrane protein insertion efficiency factor YidD [Clostridia bacterium]|nr:membrane protein insertion efficiency factor YidD [Clostridia bacterium]